MKLFIFIIFIFMICEKVSAGGCNQQNYGDQQQQQVNCDPNYYNDNKCPNVPIARNFDLDQMLGHWYIIETTLGLPDCAFAVRTRLPKYYSYSQPNYGSGGGNSYYGQQTSYDSPTTEEQMLTVNYFDPNINRARTRFMGNTTRVSYNGGSYTNAFTTGSVSDVKILYVDYDYICGYVLMITCTTQANGQFEVNSNILSRSSWLNTNVIEYLHGLLVRYGLQSVESRLRAVNHRDCQKQSQQSYSQYM